MAGSGSDCSSLSSVTDDESIFSSYDSLHQKRAILIVFILSQGTEVLLYQFKPEPSPKLTVGDSHSSIVTYALDEASSQIGNTNW